MPRQVIDELDEPHTPWSTVSRFAGLGCLLLMICIISVPFFPRFRDYQALTEEGKAVQAQLDLVKSGLETRKLELRMLESDPSYQQLKARDYLNLRKDGETIFRFPRSN